MPSHFIGTAMSASRAVGLLMFITVVAVSASGCNAKKDTSDSQLAAEVNKTGISVHQVQSALENNPRLLAEDPKQASQKVLESLIEQEIAAQAARADGLDSTPRVVQAMEVAKREVLARFYQDQLAAKVMRPTDEEIEKYYVDNPALFSNRRLYTLQESLIEGPIQSVNDMVAKTKSASELDEAMRNSGMRFQTRLLVQSAEDLPIPLLKRLAGLSEGQSVTVTQMSAVRVYTLIRAQVAPVDRATARAAIASFLITEQKRQAVADGMKKLRQGAQISYVGSFARSVEEAARPASSAAPAPKP